MQNLTVARGSLRWPNCCAACGAPASASASSTCVVLKNVGYFVVFIRTRHQYTTINYPICNRHKLLARIAGVIGARNMLNLGISVLWAFTVFGTLVGVYDLITGQQSVDINVLIINAGLALFGIATFEFGRRFTPIKLANATDQTIRLIFRNDDYAKTFAAANSSDDIGSIPDPISVQVETPEQQKAAAPFSTPYPLNLIGPGKYSCGDCRGVIDIRGTAWDKTYATKRCPYCLSPLQLPGSHLTGGL